jgi:hypothetical protein
MDMVTSSIEIMLPPLSPSNITRLNIPINWVRVTIHWYRVLILRKTIRKVAIQNKDRYRPGSPCTAKHGALRNHQAARDTIRGQN